MAKQRASRADVARAAGVSKTTVTYVLRETPNTSISQATKSRVREIAHKLGYVPHFAASSLVRGKTEIIGLLIPTASRQFYSLYSAFLEGLVEESHYSPYNFLYVGQDQPQKYRRVLAEGFVDGMIVIQSDTNEEHVTSALQYDRPIVSVNFIPTSQEIPSVSADYEHALEQSFEWVVGQGRRRIGVFIFDNDLQPNMRQLRHFQVCAERLPPGTTSTLVACPTLESIEDLYPQQNALHRFDAVILEGGYQLSVLLNRLEQSGQQVGADLDLVSMNISDYSRVLPAGTHVVESPSLEVGRTAWRLMSGLLEGRSVPRRTYIPFTTYTV